MASYGIGLLTANDKGINFEVSPNPYKSAPKFDFGVYGYGVRQKLVAYMTLYEMTKNEGQKGVEIKSNHKNNFGFSCWTEDFCNYCIYNDDFFNRDYYLSIVIDKKDNIKKALKSVDLQKLYNLLRDLPEDYSFSIYRVFGTKIRSYKPISRVLIKDLDRKFLNWLIEFAKSNKWMVAINISGKIWSLDELLSKSKHLERAQKVKTRLESIKSCF